MKLKAHWSTTSRVRRLTLSNTITGSFFKANAVHLFYGRRGAEFRGKGGDKKGGELGEGEGEGAGD